MYITLFHFCLFIYSFIHFTFIYSFIHPFIRSFNDTLNVFFKTTVSILYQKIFYHEHLRVRSHHRATLCPPIINCENSVQCLKVIHLMYFTFKLRQQYVCEKGHLHKLPFYVYQPRVETPHQIQKERKNERTKERKKTNILL